jgi:hypothetical protein
LLHDLRHLFASGLIASGCYVVTVQRALTHASATRRLNTYGHLWPHADDRTRAATDGLMSASLDNPAGPCGLDNANKCLPSAFRHVRR